MGERLRRGIVELDRMKLDRRTFLASSALLTTFSNREARAQAKEWNAEWIWYPGQLAAYRHSRRVRLAMERCSYVGYPANFRQPVSEVYFRKSGTAANETTLRWAAPVGRVRATIGGRGGDVTSREGVLRPGKQEIVFQIDFAQSLPCLLLEGANFSSGPTWEASLDGEHWVAVESGAGGNPLRLPDAEREIKIDLPVVRVVEPQGPPQERYSLAAGRDLLLDFHETELGTLRFDAQGEGEIGIQVGESIPEVRDPDIKGFEQYPIAPFQLNGSARPFETPQRALRFVRVSTTGRAELSRVRFEASMWPTEPKAHFESSDADLNAIWKTAVATLRSNMHDFYLDGIRRDGLLWHDGPLTIEAYERVFFDADLSRQTLIAESMPAHPSLRDVGIIDSPMYDVIGFEREFMVRGDRRFPLLFRDRIEDILRFFAGLQNEAGFVDAAQVQPYGFFPDWSTQSQNGPDGHGAPAYGQMLLVRAYAAASKLARLAWGEDALANKYQDAARTLRTSIRKAFRNRESGLYANGFDRAGKLDPRYTSFAQAFAIACGVASPDEYASLIGFLNDESKRSAHYSLSQVVELAAYAQAGRAQDAVKRLKSAWLPLIQQGYGRFFEDIKGGKPADEQLGMYGRKYAASLCHAWAGAAPVIAISKGILGIEPIEPGYAVCSIAPQPCGLTSARCAVPTPHGEIEISWKNASAEVTLPKGVSARLPGGRAAAGPGRFSFNLA